MPQRKPDGPGKNRLQVQVNDQISDHLDRLLDTGLWGLTRAEVARRLICEGIQKHGGNECVSAS
jgi:hypothetical protein